MGQRQEQQTNLALSDQPELIQCRDGVQMVAVGLDDALGWPSRSRGVDIGRLIVGLDRLRPLDQLIPLGRYCISAILEEVLVGPDAALFLWHRLVRGDAVIENDRGPEVG